MAIKLDGKLVSSIIREEIKQEVLEILNDQEDRAPHCAVVLVGDDPASSTYVKNKEKAFKDVFMMSSTYRLDNSITQKELLDIIHLLNNDDDIDGILVQLPLPKHIDSKVIIEAIDPNKDVDGLTMVNQGKLYSGIGLEPCTPAGVIELLRRYEIDLAGKHCVVVGRSDLVGRPLSVLLLKENGTVTICHSKTSDLKAITQQADVLLVAIGQKQFITPEYLKEGVVLVDVGIHRHLGKIVGDCDPSCYDKTSYYTPVPGSVGPMTITMLLKNTLKAFNL